eukprot:GHVQ01015168.1.p1 GENE.GHVQ01015168.1~~GHVQ01015168.1.p1  ORF type:complete len:1254 (-),score=140.73 GHVQ01015168.1:543-4304(-)
MHSSSGEALLFSPAPPHVVGSVNEAGSVTSPLPHAPYELSCSLTSYSQDHHLLPNQITGSISSYSDNSHHPQDDSYRERSEASFFFDRHVRTETILRRGPCEQTSAAYLQTPLPLDQLRKSKQNDKTCHLVSRIHSGSHPVLRSDYTMHKSSNRSFTERKQAPIDGNVTDNSDKVSSQSIDFNTVGRDLGKVLNRKSSLLHVPPNESRCIASSTSCIISPVLADNSTRHSFINSNACMMSSESLGYLPCSADIVPQCSSFLNDSPKPSPTSSSDDAVTSGAAVPSLSSRPQTTPISLLQTESVKQSPDAAGNVASMVPSCSVRSSAENGLGAYLPQSLSQAINNTGVINTGSVSTESALPMLIGVLQSLYEENVRLKQQITELQRDAACKFDPNCAGNQISSRSPQPSTATSTGEGLWLMKSNRSIAASIRFQDPPLTWDSDRFRAAVFRVNAVHRHVTKGEQRLVLMLKLLSNAGAGHDIEIRTTGETGVTLAKLRRDGLIAGLLTKRVCENCGIDLDAVRVRDCIIVNQALALFLSLEYNGPLMLITRLWMPRLSVGVMQPASANHSPGVGDQRYCSPNHLAHTDSNPVTTIGEEKIPLSSVDKAVVRTCDKLSRNADKEASLLVTSQSTEPIDRNCATPNKLSQQATQADKGCEVIKEHNTSQEARVGTQSSCPALNKRSPCVHLKPPAVGNFLGQLQPYQELSLPSQPAGGRGSLPAPQQLPARSPSCDEHVQLDRRPSDKFGTNESVSVTSTTESPTTSSEEIPENTTSYGTKESVLFCRANEHEFNTDTLPSQKSSGSEDDQEPSGLRVFRPPLVPPQIRTEKLQSLHSLSGKASELCEAATLPTGRGVVARGIATSSDASCRSPFLQRPTFQKTEVPQDRDFKKRKFQENHSPAIQPTSVTSHEFETTNKKNWETSRSSKHSTINSSCAPEDRKTTGVYTKRPGCSGRDVVSGIVAQEQLATIANKKDSSRKAVELWTLADSVVDLLPPSLESTSCGEETDRQSDQKITKRKVITTATASATNTKIPLAWSRTTHASHANLSSQRNVKATIPVAPLRDRPGKISKTISAKAGISSIGERHTDATSDSLPNYREVVRNRDERQRLPAFDCSQCEKFYAALNLDSTSHQCDHRVNCQPPRLATDVGHQKAPVVTMGDAMQGSGPGQTVRNKARGDVKQPTSHVAGEGQARTIGRADSKYEGREKSRYGRGGMLNTGMLIQTSSRHRYYQAPPETPPGFWDMDFPPTQL